MKRLLNTLFVTSPGAYLSRKGEAVLVRVENETKLHVPIHTLDGIVCFGQVMCSPSMLGLCGERNVTVSFLTDNGKFLARVQGPVSGNVLLRRQQYRLADDLSKAAEIARSIVIAKIANCRIILLRAAREETRRLGQSEGSFQVDNADCNPAKSRPRRDGQQALSQTASRLGRLLKDLKRSLDLETVRGLEGMAANIYFAAFDNLITAQKEDFFLRGRSRRPPLDNMNGLLSFAYTLLLHDVISALETVGLDPAVGYLHKDRPGRPGLALDCMEEFRPFLADRLALSLVNRNQIKGKEFRKTESGAVMMDDKARKKVLTAYQKRKQEIIHHPFLDEKIAVGLLPHVQAMLMARHLRGDLDGYPPFLWK